jgi:hypothetical protein
MMKCGHVAHGKCHSKGGVKFDPPIPCCITCDCTEVDDSPPSLEGRKARCAYWGICHCEMPSSRDLPFFEYRGPGTNHYAGEKETDEFYCGCRGWD